MISITIQGKSEAIASVEGLKWAPKYADDILAPLADDYHHNCGNLPHHVSC